MKQPQIARQLMLLVLNVSPPTCGKMGVATTSKGIFAKTVENSLCCLVLPRKRNRPTKRQAPVLRLQKSKALGQILHLVIAPLGLPSLKARRRRKLKDLVEPKKLSRSGSWLSNRSCLGKWRNSRKGN